MSEKTLQDMISKADHLTEGQKQSLYDLVAKGCRAKTKDRLASKIWNVPLSCWENCGRYERVYFNGDSASYCAGQSYPDEIRTLRELFLGGR